MESWAEPGLCAPLGIRGYPEVWSHVGCRESCAKARFSLGLPGDRDSAGSKRLSRRRPGPRREVPGPELLQLLGQQEGEAAGGGDGLRGLPLRAPPHTHTCRREDLL